MENLLTGFSENVCPLLLRESTVLGFLVQQRHAFYNVCLQLMGINAIHTIQDHGFMIAQTGENA